MHVIFQRSFENGRWGEWVPLDCSYEHRARAIFEIGTLSRDCAACAEVAEFVALPAGMEPIAKQGERK